MKVSDNLKEIFDVVDEEDRVVGQTTRGQVHRNKKLIHRSIGVAVFNKKGELFLQQRSKTKDTDPNKWTISCSGHVISGHSYEETAHRELKEELGLDYENLQRQILISIKPVCKYICYAPNETEIVMLFKARFDGPFTLNKEEITQGKFFTRKELNHHIKLGKIELSFSGRESLRKLGWA